ncbi:leucine-rich repeat-containing protein egg-6-like [Diachasmimorpha longicaudata]|uniref:leucine-rich repeat-containing protein egg-6-like n=1 Tax=Diachasmimorpha longicaudata TaxID=58733 RepID=UPI0030B90C27
MSFCETIASIVPLFIALDCEPHPPPPRHDALCEDSTGYVNMKDIGGQRIGKDFLQNSSFTCINLSGNNITEIEEGALNGMKDLIYLNLSGNQLSPEFLTTFSHPKLRVLVLDDAFADDSLPEDIPKSPTILSEFPKLQQLYLRRNNLEGLIVPSWHLSLPDIKQLYLDDNRLESTDFLTGLSRSLTHLSLANNHLSFFKTESLDNLEVLNLDNNQLSKLCENESCSEGVYLNNATNVRFLSLSNNNLSRMDQGAMKDLVNVKYLNLANNSLSEIPHLAFQNLTSLFDINLSNNGLQNIPDLCNLRKLKFLNLSHNFLLKSIKREAFCDLPDLDQIDLKYNGIPEKSPQIFFDIVSNLSSSFQI